MPPTAQPKKRRQKPPMLRRAVKVNLKFATARKQRAIKALLAEYRAAVNFYIRSLWKTKGNLDKSTAARLPLTQTRLSHRYRNKALHQALDIVITTRKAAKATGRRASIPHFKGAALLSSSFVVIEPGQHTFDLIIKLSTLKKGRRIAIPTRKTAVLNKWLAMPGAKLVQGCALTAASITLWVEMPIPEPKTTGKTLGLDVGIHKLISDSEGNHYGTEFKQLRDRVRRCKPGSAGKRRARIARDQFICRIVKQLPGDGYQEPEFFVLPVRWIRKHHTPAKSGWDKVRTKGQRIDRFKNEKGFELIAKEPGIRYPR